MEKYNIYFSHYTRDHGREHNKSYYHYHYHYYDYHGSYVRMLKSFLKKKNSYFIHSF